MKKRLLSIILSITMIMSPVSVYAADPDEVVESVEESSEDGSSDEGSSDEGSSEGESSDEGSSEDESSQEESDGEEAGESGGDEQSHEVEELVLTVTEVPSEPEVTSDAEETLGTEVTSEVEETSEPEVTSEAEEKTEPEIVTEAAESSELEEISGTEVSSEPEKVADIEEGLGLETLAAQGAKTNVPEENNASSYNDVAKDYINGIRDTYTKEVENISTSQSSTGRYNVNFTLIEKNNRTGIEKKYLYTVSGFPSEESVASYLNAIISLENVSSEIMYGVSNSGLVDAEKRPWKYKEGDENPDQNAYDSNLCWAGSTSDMLELAGWNKAGLITNHGKDLSDEDRLFDLYADNFTDEAGNQIYGIEWFFDGLNLVQGDEGWAQLKNEEGYSEAFLKEYCVDDFARSYSYPGKEEFGSILKNLDSDEDGDRCSIGIVFGYYEDDGQGKVVRNGGHCVTIVGYSTDENGVPNAITIADSDSYDNEGPNYSSDKVRDSYINSYSTYPVEYYDGKWHLMNFSNPDNIIDDLIVLKYYSDNTKDRLENGGTLDLINYLDYYTDMERVYTDNYKNSVSTVYQGDLLNAGFRIRDKSYYKNYDFEYLPYRFEISKDGSIVRTVDECLDMSLVTEGGVGYFIGTNIMDSVSSFEPGEYTVSFIINYDRSITEAYYNNNRSKSRVTFTVLKRVDEDGNVHYVVVPESSSSSSDDDRETMMEYIQVPVEHLNSNEHSFDYSAVAERSAYEMNPDKVLEFRVPETLSGTDITDEDISIAEVLYDYSVMGNLEGADGSFGGQIKSNVVITKDDYKIVRNADGSLSIVFSNAFMKKLPKGTHYFRFLIAGKIQIFRIEVK